MRFSEYLAAEAVPEWHRKYINYEALLKALNEIPRVHGSHLSMNLSALMGKHRHRRRPSNVSAQSIGSSAGHMPGLIPAGHNLRGGRHDQARTSIALSVHTPTEANFPGYMGSRRPSAVSAQVTRGMPNRVSFQEPAPSNPGEGLHTPPNFHSRRRSSINPPPMAANTWRPEPGDSDPTLRQSPLNPQLLHPSPQIPERQLYSSAPDVRLEGYEGQAPFDPFTIHQQLERRGPEERSFFTLFEKELQKVSDFYNELETKLQTRFSKLNEQCEHHQQMRRNLNRRSSLRAEVAKPVQKFVTGLLPGRLGGSKSTPSQSARTYRDVGGPKTPRPSLADSPSGGWSNRRDSMDPSQLLDFKYRSSKSKLKKATLELYRGIELAQNYRILNYTGFIKLLQKYERFGTWTDGVQFYLFTVENHQFIRSASLDTMYKDVENLYITNFAGGSRKKGLRKLHIPDSRFSIFSGVYLVNALLILIGLDMYIWGRNRINYKFIYGFNPRDNLSNIEYLEIPLFLFFLTTLFMCITITNPFYPTISSYLFPGILILLTIFIFVLPLKLFHFSARLWFMNNVRRLLLTPLLTVKFKDFFLADQLNSLTYSIGAMHLAGCAYAEHWDNLSTKCNVSHTWVYPAVTMMPSMWRCLQCLRRGFLAGNPKRNFSNALKYFLAALVHWLAALYRIHPSRATQVSWLVIAFTSTTYSYIWDVFMDWSMFEMENGRPRLRKERKYSWTWAYWFAIFTNFILRYGWVSSLTPTYFFLPDRNHYDLVAFITAFTDVYRRFQWNIFRMENEHVNNCGQFRATKDIPLPYDLPPNHQRDPGLDTQDSDLSGYTDYVNVFHTRPNTPNGDKSGSPNVNWTMAPMLVENDSISPIKEAKDGEVRDYHEWATDEIHHRPESPADSFTETVGGPSPKLIAKRPNSVVIIVPEK
ncbi:Signal transduction protein [Dimargaris cristalligena]|nr:Signal transduction protein [Dimargaris cristalligena]